MMKFLQRENSKQMERDPQQHKTADFNQQVQKRLYDKWVSNQLRGRKDGETVDGTGEN